MKPRLTFIGIGFAGYVPAMPLASLLHSSPFVCFRAGLVIHRTEGC